MKDRQGIMPAMLDDDLTAGRSSGIRKRDADHGG